MQSSNHVQPGQTKRSNVHRALTGAAMGGLVGMGVGAGSVIATGIIRALLEQGTTLREFQSWWPLLLLVWAVMGGMFGGGCGAFGGVIGALCGGRFGRGAALTMGAGAGALAVVSVLIAGVLSEPGDTLVDAVLLLLAIGTAGAVGGGVGTLAARK